ncbi:MAG TPA: hypothetical protein DCS43_14735 [Verrucomicrobia bacterium]|nr:hypothetical protein [Verrucomicrobiota bacterium]
MDKVTYNGWKNCVRLANRDIELIVTTAVGPRVARLGFIGERNLFAEIPGQQGGSGESEWMIRGGHRFWIAPEQKPMTYELDNSPIAVEEIAGGVRTLQPVGALSGCAKRMDITLDANSNRIHVLHTLTNHGERSIHIAPWALSVMAPDGMAIIPRPAFIPHTDRVLHNQEWSLWGYTDLTDPRWSLGQKYLFFRQDRHCGPSKLGIAHREGWVGYQLGEFLFVKHFDFDETAVYPDGGVNFETFSNEEILELETLGGLIDLAPETTVSLTETWDLHRSTPTVTTEAEADRWVKSRV